MLSDLRELFRTARCVFFDCDGVILDSNAMKLGALDEVLDGFPESIRAQMRAYWAESGGLSRYEKFGHFAREIVRARDPDALAAASIARFASLTRARYDRCEPLPDALRLLTAAGPQRAFVVSGTDQAELREVFEDKGLRGLCADVLGSPRTKVEHIVSTLARCGASPSQALFIGDGGGDFSACQQTGVHFVYLAQMSHWPDALSALHGARGATWADSLSALCQAWL